MYKFNVANPMQWFLLSMVRLSHWENIYTVSALKISNVSNFRQGKKYAQVYSNRDEFPVSLISAIGLKFRHEQEAF